MQLVLTSDLLIEAYKQGLFPMAYGADSPYIHWVCPEERGQLSITDIHLPRSLLRDIRRGKIGGNPYEIRVDTDFDTVIESCAAATDTRPESWINEPIMAAFKKLHREGHAHSVECLVNNTLVGGVYGLKIGGVFCGESMFSRHTNASKVALIHLCARLHKGGFGVLDTQFVNDHLIQFGVHEIPHRDYIERLKAHIHAPADFALEGIGEDQIMSEYLEMRRL